MANERAIEFFAANCGIARFPHETEDEARARCARELAEAEAEAIERAYVFEWINDDEPCIGCECGDETCDCYTGAPHEVLGCIVRANPNDRPLAALFGICGATPAYRRLIEAELAMEAILT